MNILDTLKLSTQLVIPQTYFVLEILCKYSLGLFHLKIHSMKG